MKNIDKRVPVYSIGAAKKLTGLSARQIRYYEEMNLICPARTGSNRRVYSQSDIETLLTIKKLIGDGMTIEGVRSALKKMKVEGNEEEEKAPAEVSEDEKLEEPEILPGQVRGLKKLASLYPINHRAELIRRLQPSSDNHEEERR